MFLSLSPLFLFLFFSLLCLFSTTQLPSPQSSEESLLSPRQTIDPQHTAWNQTLQWLLYPGQSINGISTTAVDYSTVRRKIDDNHNNFNVYLKNLEHWDPQDLESAPDSEKMCVFLNAYNAFAVKIIRNNPCKIRFGKYCWPLRSIRDLGEWGSEIFDLEKGKIAGKGYSLNDLFEKFREIGDARALLALSKTALSSPDIPPIAFETFNLDLLLNTSVQLFLKNSDKGMYLDTIANTLYVSDLFQQYEDDFIAYSGSIEGFITEFYPDDEVTQWIIDHEPDVKYLDWRWNLNTLEQAGVHFSYV